MHACWDGCATAVRMVAAHIVPGSVRAKEDASALTGAAARISINDVMRCRQEYAAGPDRSKCQRPAVQMSLTGSWICLPCHAFRLRT